MTATTQEGGLAGALAALQAELPDIAKDKTARVKTDKAQYSYRYADLATISRIVLPALGRHGLAWTTRPTMQDSQFVLAYKLAHRSGETEEGIYPLPDPVRSSPQAVGSAITYARRYALCSVTGVAPDDDDDDAAQAAASHHEQRQAERRPAPGNGRPAQQQAEQPPTGPPAPTAVRDWALGSDRNPEGLENACQRLQTEHPLVAAAEVVNENGDQEQLQVLLLRRAREMAAAVGQTEPPPAAEPQQSAEERRRKRMQALLGELGYQKREERLGYCSLVLGRDIETSKDLRFPREVEQIIAALERQQRQPQPEGVPA